MTEAELIDKLTDIVMQQAKTIRELYYELAQYRTLSEEEAALRYDKGTRSDKSTDKKKELL